MAGNLLNHSFDSNDARSDGDDPPADVYLQAIAVNTDLLHRLLEQVRSLPSAPAQPAAGGLPLTSEIWKLDDGDNDPQLGEVRRELDELAGSLRQMQAENEELRQQNAELAAKLAASGVRRTVTNTESNTGAGDALSWEQRKQLILEQMERDSFDAEAFVQDLQGQSGADVETPEAFFDRLKTDLDRSQAEVAKREAEIGELRCLLQQQSETRESGVAIGAAAIAEMVDADELVQQERQRLQQLQAEWEEKFRQNEIEASLERAKLSRERQALAKKAADLEEQIEHIRRESRLTDENGSASSRRWLVKLGLAGD